MNFLYSRQISQIENLINEIHSSLALLDERYCKYDGLIDEREFVDQLSKKMDVLWEKYWKLSKIAHKINISYLSFGRSTNLIEALEHLIFEWFLIVIDRVKIENLSQNWINFSTTNNTWKLFYNK